MEKINSFLTLGYFLDYQNPDLTFDFSGVDKSKYAQATEQELIEEGSKLWLEAIAANYNPNDKHLVPISGGLDSRAVLAGLLKHTEAKNIHTYTFGTPKTLDYDIGNYIAKKLGTNHTEYDLTNYNYSQEELEDISVRVDRQTILFHHPPVWEVEKKFAGFKLWSGFGGDAISGIKYKSNESKSIKAAFLSYLNSNKYTKSIGIEPPYSNDPKIKHLVNYEGISFDEVITLENIVAKFEAPHVALKGFDYALPVIYKPWIDFILSVPNKYRLNQHLYKEILMYTFPKEFSWKTKTNLGLPLNASKLRFFLKRVKDKGVRTIFSNVAGSGTNYLDFNYQIRNKPDLKKVISTNVLDLKQRNIIDRLDPQEILNKHLSGKANHADILIALASLEIHLKTGLKL